MWSDGEQARWLRAHRELREATIAYGRLPRNADGHLEIGVPPEREAWDRLERAWANVEKIRIGR
jgi:hypothetical protein